MFTVYSPTNEQCISVFTKECSALLARCIYTTAIFGVVERVIYRKTGIEHKNPAHRTIR